MHIKTYCLVFFNFLLVSCGFAQTTLEGSLMHDGILRTYRLYIPAAYKPAVPVPLLFNLHGYGSNNVEQENYGDFRRIADTAGFIIVHPNGTFDGTNNRFWNTFGNSAIDDIGFISALIDRISTDYRIDLNRIYSTGMSNGGFMSYELACRLSNRIAAIASVTGSMTYDHINSCNALHPVPVMEIHGTADGTVPYMGNLLFYPIDNLVDYWVKHNNCSITPVIKQLPDINTLDGSTAEMHVYDKGISGSKVELYKIIGGGHTWPGAPVTIGVTNRDFNASVEIWRFLSRYNLKSLTTGIDDGHGQVAAIKVFPNPGQGKFRIKFAGISEKSITVTNYLGQIVQRFSCTCQETGFNIEDKGIYLISVKAGNQTITEKVVSY